MPINVPDQTPRFHREPKDKPFRANRQTQRIEMVMVERSSLLLLTSLSKAILEEGRKATVPSSHATTALEIAINLAERALKISARAHQQ